MKAAGGFEPRAAYEIAALTNVAYGVGLGPDRLERGLQAAASALGEGDLARAMVAAVHLRLPPLDPGSAARLAAAEDVLTKLNKWDTGEPRGWHGRWTDEDEDEDEDEVLSPASRLFRAPSQSAGGAFYQTAGEDDEEPEELAPAEPRPPPEDRPPDEWERPDGSRQPELYDGRPWPEATPSVVRRILSAQSDGAMPRMVIYVPKDGRGPLLLGETDKEEFIQPRGYDRGTLYGNPQVTRSRGIETRHADDSVERALVLAGTNQYSELYFNRSISTVTSGETESRLRPDVMLVVRPHLDLDFRLTPLESLSPGQRAKDREQQLDDIPGLGRLDAEHYKFLLKVLRSLGLVR